MSCIFERHPILEGILPDNLLPYKYNTDNFDMYPKLGGNVPIIALVFKSIDVTALDVQVMPVHVNPGVQGSLPITAPLPSQRQPVRPDIVPRLVEAHRSQRAMVSYTDIGA